VRKKIIARCHRTTRADYRRPPFGDDDGRTH
jgi:hypothetical protein